MASAGEPAADRHLQRVVTFADTLLDKGVDRFGPKQTAMWCAVMRIADHSVPKVSSEAPAAKGDRDSDRAVGGCNPCHDAVTMRVFKALSAVTGNARYGQAVDAYLKDFVANAQNPTSGLCAWGEHAHYKVHSDEVAQAAHEYLEWTPPLELLWAVDAEAARREIDGLKFHFLDADPAKRGWLFDRHANLGGGYAGGSHPFIKHAGLYVYAYMVAYARTKDASWAQRAAGIGGLYWDKRDPTTGLVMACIGDGRPRMKESWAAGTGLLAYWMLKGASLAPDAPVAVELRNRALALLKSYDKHGWDAQKQAYATRLRVADGGVAVPPSSPYDFNYGETSALYFGRAAAFAARVFTDADCLTLAKRVGTMIAADTPAEQAEPMAYGFAMNHALDLFDLTGDRAQLALAQRLADLAGERLFEKGLIRRAARDAFYESKTGAGDLLAGLLRLHLRSTGAKDPGVYDWSF